MDVDVDVVMDADAGAANGGTVAEHRGVVGESSGPTLDAGVGDDVWFTEDVGRTVWTGK